MDPLKVLADAFGRISQLAEVFIAGWKSFYLPAEYFINVFDRTIPVPPGVLANQAMDLRLPYDFYVYGIGITSTGAPLAAAPFSFLIKASGGGVLFGNAEINSTTLWSAQEPVLWLRRPFKIGKFASLSVDLTDLSGAPNTIQIALVGWKSASAYQAGQ